MSRIFKILILFTVATISITHAKPTIYKRNQDNVFERVMVPVSSTVIPLPMYKMEYELGFVAKNKNTQPTFKPETGIKLITIKRSQEKKT
ncbi:uncharacterized protein LOC143181862 [Calliopsis andreniformis]|uniref:uncharacterized protein LOC143181862 n=1 Tax=Calliopsis andreniformis TaxID=337506 RepID=UPI003FCCE5A7